MHLAYQTYGSGPLDILVMPGFVSHVERAWEHPASRSFLASLMKLGRLIVFDRRGIGLSDRVGSAPDIDITAEDIGTVLRAVDRAASCCSAHPSADQPASNLRSTSRVSWPDCILFGALAKGCWSQDYPHALRASQYDAWSKRLIAQWGGPVEIETFAPSLAGDPQARAWWAGLLRAASSPGGISAVLEAFRDADVRQLLPQIAMPTLVLHRRDDKAVRIAAGRDVASRIKGAQFVELDGHDHWFFAGDQRPVLDAIRDS